MRKLLVIIVLHLTALAAHAQVYMRAFEPAGLLAVGGAGIANPDAGGGRNNEAQLGIAPQTAFIAGGGLPYGVGDWKTGQFQGTLALDKNSALGLSAQFSGTAVYTEQNLQLQYGRKLGEKFSMGASAILINLNQQEYGKATGVTFSLGMMAHVLPQLYAGARILNPLGQDFQGEALPSAFQTGICWLPSKQLRLSGDVDKTIDRPAQVKIGMQYSPGETIDFRIGIRSAPARPAFGFGLHFKPGLSLQVASEWHPTLGITPAAMICWRPAKNVSK